MLTNALPFVQTRSFAAVIFRRIASKTRKVESGENLDMFYSLAKDQAAVIRQKLLETLAAEPERAVRNKISDAVAEVARQYTESSQSPAHSPCWVSFFAADYRDVNRRPLARTSRCSVPTQSGPRGREA